MRLATMLLPGMVAGRVDSPILDQASRDAEKGIPMSTRIEWLDAAHTAIDWEKPLTEIGSDTLGPGRYALTIGNVVIEGKPEDLADVSAAINRAASYLSEHAARPLTHSDFNYDAADNGYTCPRCEAFLEPAMYSGLVGLIQAIDAHIAGHRPEHEHGE